MTNTPDLALWLPLPDIAERQLAEGLGVSRVTIQRAYAALRQRDLLASQGRKGFLVRPRPDQVHPGMDRLKGFTEEMHELGKIPSSRILERSVVQDRSISSIFGLPSTAPLPTLAQCCLRSARTGAIPPRPMAPFIYG